MIKALQTILRKYDNGVYFNIIMVIFYDSTIALFEFRSEFVSSYRNIYSSISRGKVDENGQIEEKYYILLTVA